MRKRGKFKREVRNRSLLLRRSSEDDIRAGLIKIYYHVRGLSSNRSGDLVIVPVRVVGFPKSDFRDCFWRELFAVYELPVMIDMYIYKKERDYIYLVPRDLHIFSVTESILSSLQILLIS